MPNTPYNEMYFREGAGRAHYLRYSQWLGEQPADRLAQKRAEAQFKSATQSVTAPSNGNPNPNPNPNPAVNKPIVK